MNKINWNTIDQASDLRTIHEASYHEPQFIFKHSTRCPVSSIVMNRLDKESVDLKVSYNIHFLDLIQYQAVSQEISEEYNVRHESPQLLVIHDGECKHHASHFDISLERIPEEITAE